MAAAIQELRKELGEAITTPVGIFCLTATSIGLAIPNPDIPDLLRRIEALRARGGDVLLFRERELYAMTGLVNRYTKAPLRFVAGLSLLIRAFVDPYGNLEGGVLKPSRVFSAKMRAFTPIRWPRRICRNGWRVIPSLAGNGARRMAGSPPNSCATLLLLATCTRIFSRTISSFRCKPLWE
jgi:hypothetical protein